MRPPAETGVRILVIIIGTAFGTICPLCGQACDTVDFRHRNTCYIDHSMNYLVSCYQCWLDDFEYYEELWQLSRQ